MVDVSLSAQPHVTCRENLFVESMRKLRRTYGNVSIHLIIRGNGVKYYVNESDRGLDEKKRREKIRESAAVCNLKQ